MKDYPAKKAIKNPPKEVLRCAHGTLGGNVDCIYCLGSATAPDDAAEPSSCVDPIDRNRRLMMHSSEIGHYAPPPVSVVNALGAKLKQLRESQGLTIEQVAARLDGELWRVNNMEHDPDPNISTLTQYAAALDAEVIVDVRQTQASLKAEHARLLDRLADVESQIMGLE